ncbi:MAG: CoA-binding protein, partial [Acidimicrobiia bacterium]|nr:CoA-binding protein [Acidimicrobiia bacterium]
MNNTESVLSKYRRIAVVGLSPSPLRDALGVARFLVEMGYDVVGVN